MRRLVLCALAALLATTDAGSAAEAPLATDDAASARPWTRYRGWTDEKWPAFNTLAEPTRSPPAPPPGAEKVIEGAIAGDPEKGRQLAFDRRRGGSCVACHVMGPTTPELPGNVGPDLSEIGAAGRSDQQLYNQIWDSRVYNPQTVMPPWGAHGVFTDAEIRDIVAFLKTLTTPAVFKNALDDPATRPAPVEDRDNLDPFINPAMEAVEHAAALFKQEGPKGKACNICHGQPEQAFKTWAASMPRWEPRLNKVIGVEEFITRHASATTGAAWPMQSRENTALAIWLRHLANGAPMAVDVTSPGAAEAAERGKQLMSVKLGQLNFACLDCHQIAANTWIRGQWLGESKGQLPHFPTWRTSRNEIWDIRKRFQWCGVAIRADELPPDAKEYGDLELYLASLNTGLKLNAPGIRH